MVASAKTFFFLRNINSKFINMKKILFFLLFFTIIMQCVAQKELWGYKNYLGFQPNNPSLSNGQIIKVPLAGNNSIAEVMHTFDPTGALGKYPRGRLFQASNGKLYGVTGAANFDDPIGGIVPNSVLFEYDLILNKYTVITQLNYPNAGVIEPLPGILMGTTNNGNSVYKYNFNTGVFAITASIPSFFIPDLSNGTTYFPAAISELFKASDGNLYYTTSISRNTPPQIVGRAPGGIYKYNLITNTISKVYYFGQDDFSPSAIFSPLPTRFIEGAPGKLYNITSQGFITYNPNSLCGQYSCGVLYEFDINTNAVTIKYEYDYYALGAGQDQLMRVSNTKILGTSYNYSGPLSDGVPNRYGVIYEYDIPSNTVSLKHAITSFQSDDGVAFIGSGKLCSDGNYYNVSYSSIYRYNPNSNVINKKIANTGDGNLQEMIEVCRKPSYQEILINTFTPAVGTTFTYNINNTNATTYVWQKGTTVLPLQTTSILTLTNVTTSDTGVYTCTMTNECGTTVTANLNINVSNLGTDTIDNYKQQITLYPNPTKGSINLKFPENRGLKATSYKITNLLGQIIEEKDISTSTKNELIINTTSYANGVYQITLVTDKGNWNGKFIKE